MYQIIIISFKLSTIFIFYQYFTFIQANDLRNKQVYLVIFQGGVHEILKNKMNKIIESFGASKFNLPTNLESFKSKQKEIDDGLKEAWNLLKMTKAGLEIKLDVFSNQRFDNGNCSFIEELKLFIAKEKILYYHMNLLKQQNNSFTTTCWIPALYEDKILFALQNIKKRKRLVTGAELTRFNDVPAYLSPPTFFRTNAFTMPFQLIVDTYGVPRYREVNPGLFAISFFPFLFGVMFGDIGHGGLLFAFGLWMCYANDELRAKKSAFLPLLDFRFLFTLMGFFAFYCGFIYNDFFSIPLNLFGTCWDKAHDSNLGVLQENCVVWFGMDPSWYLASNELNFFNSLKMKMSVIIGVFQMCFGIMLKAVNAIQFQQPLDFIFEFVPQIIFMCVTFVYMDFLIFVKWLSDWKTIGTHKAPSIIGVLINMPLKMGSTDGMPLYDQETQELIQFRFLMIALICIPIMLLPKPLCLLLQDVIKSKKKTGNQYEHLLEKEQSHGGGHGHGHGEFEFGEVFVHQMIESIEFVLGSISNTASYLRLWALSLAHNQLAKVFFEKCIGGSITSGSFIGIFIGYFMFANVTFAVLMCMDQMECFLHALRLQWVEFQNKFYKADGHKFVPFSFTTALTEKA